MEHRRLGTDGPEIPVLMFGAWPIAGGLGAVDPATAVATINRALELGITAVDTAEGYRESEAIVGRALGAAPRERVFIATKASIEPYTLPRIRDALDQSLRNLGTDYVDIYQIHRFPTSVPLEEAMAGLADAQQSGKARYVGVSNFTVAQIAAARAIHPIQSLQPRFSIFASQAAHDLLPYCANEGIGVIVHSPLAKGLLTGKYQAGHRFSSDDERSGFPRFRGETFASYLALADDLAGLARAKGVSLVQLAIAWTLANPAVTSCIVGAKTPAQVEEHLGALDVRLTSDDLTRIDEVAARALTLPA